MDNTGHRVNREVSGELTNRGREELSLGETLSSFRAHDDQRAERGGSPLRFEINVICEFEKEEKEAPTTRANNQK